MRAVAVAVAAIALLSPLHLHGHQFERVDDLSVSALRVPILALRTIVITPARLRIGREVSVRDVDVVRVDRGGFWISVPHSNDEILVLPAEGSLIGVGAGDIVSVRGEIRPMTRPLHRARQTTTAWDEQLYIYAYVVRPTGIGDYRATRPSTDSATARRSD
jgi:hypothetical protein